MIESWIDLALAVYALGGIIALHVVAGQIVAVRIAAARHRKKALSYLRRAEDGTLYVVGPQTGTLHRLDDQIVKRTLGSLPNSTARQQKKVRRQVRQALGAR